MGFEVYALSSSWPCSIEAHWTTEVFFPEAFSVFHIHGVSEKTVQNCVCQNLVKFPSNVLIFDW